MMNMSTCHKEELRDPHLKVYVQHPDLSMHGYYLFLLIQLACRTVYCCQGFSRPLKALQE